MFTRAVLLALMLFVFCGCAGITLGQKSKGGDLFENPDDLEYRISLLESGAAEEDTLCLLGIHRKIPNFELLDTEATQMLVYGRSQAQGRLKDLEEFRNKMARLKTYNLPYEKITRKMAIEWNHYILYSSGYQLRLILIFEDGKLWQAKMLGKVNVDEEEKVYVADLLRKGFDRAIQEIPVQTVRYLFRTLPDSNSGSNNSVP